MTAAGYALVAAGLLFVALGMAGLLRFRHFFARILVSSNIDAAGLLLMMAGIALQSQSAAFALKVVVIAVLSLITSPLSTHAVLRSARSCGYRCKPGEKL